MWKDYLIKFPSTKSNFGTCSWVHIQKWCQIFKRISNFYAYSDWTRLSDFFLKNLFLFLPLLTEWRMWTSTTYTHFVMYILSFSPLSRFNFKIDVNSISYGIRPRLDGMKRLLFFQLKQTLKKFYPFLLLKCKLPLLCFILSMKAFIAIQTE